VKTELSIMPNITAERNKLLIFIKIPNLHICIFSILNAVVNLCQYILYAVNEKNWTISTKQNRFVWELGKDYRKSETDVRKNGRTFKNRHENSRVLKTIDEVIHFTNLLKYHYGFFKSSILLELIHLLLTASIATKNFYTHNKKLKWKHTIINWKCIHRYIPLKASPGHVHYCNQRWPKDTAPPCLLQINKIITSLKRIEVPIQVQKSSREEIITQWLNEVQEVSD